MRILLVILSAGLLSACGPSDERVFHGYLCFVQSPYLMRFSLRDGEITMLAHLGNRTVREISPFGEGRLLLSETASVNRKNVARIAWFDLKTGQSESLYSGVQARYVEDAGTLVYDDGGTLYAVSLADSSDSVLLKHRRNQLAAMLEISDGRLLVETREDGQPVVYLYRALDGALQRMDALGARCRLDGAVWIDDLAQLACRQRETGGEDAPDGYVLAGLDGDLTARPALPEGGSLLALAYLPDQGVIVFRESREGLFEGQHNHAVWAHDIRSGENHLLSKTLNLGTSVVYTVH